MMDDDGAAVAVVLVSYHTGPILTPAVASVLADPAVREVVVVDNGNPPGALADLPIDPRLSVLTGHGNVGFAAGCHIGVSATSAPLVLILNPDCMVPDLVLTRLVAAMAGTPEPWIASPVVRGQDGREQAGGRRWLPSPGRCLAEATGFSRLPFARNWGVTQRHRPLTPGRMPVPALSGAFMLMPRTTWTSLGGLDSGYFLHVEDLDIAARLQAAGGRCWVVGDLAVLHVKGTSAAPAWTVERHKIAGFRRYFAQHNPGPLGMLALGVIAIGLWARTRLRRLARRARRHS